MPLRGYRPPVGGWLVIAVAVLSAAGGARADVLLYRWEGDVLPHDKSAGWLIFDACDDPCSESIEDGHFVLDWPENEGDFVQYTLRIAVPPDEPPPPPFWVEWQFRSNEPKHPNFFSCDADFSIVYVNIPELVYLFGDAVISFSGGEFVFGLALDEFHTYRFESNDGSDFRFSVDGFAFYDGVYSDGPLGLNNGLHFVGGGGCSSNEPLATRNEWDYVRYGRITTGERIVTTDPPQGFLDPEEHAGLDRFTVTFDQPNYVYIDDITVTVSDGVAPVVIQTRRLDNGEPETVQIVLDRPLPLDTVIRFDFLENGEVTNTVVYGEAQPIPAISTWGVIVTLLAILTLGTLVFRGRSDIVHRAA